MNIEYTYHDYHKETPKGKDLSSKLLSKMEDAIKRFDILHFADSTFKSQQVITIINHYHLC